MKFYVYELIEFYLLFKNMLKTLGFEFVRRELAPHGIILEVT
jgi:hypothetical protein